MSKVFEYFPTIARVTDREVGIEVEMEGENLPTGTPITGWRQESDGSLRGNSCEFVLARPVHRDQVKRSLNILHKALKGSGAKLAKTDRCGVHVHVNVQDLEFQQLINFVLLYLAFEEILVKYCGEDREGNLFCLRATDADYILAELLKSKKKSTLSNISNDTFRYASVNLAALAKYGSVEFRSLKTPDDVNSIDDWVSLLLAVKDFSLTFNDSKEIVEGFSRNGEIPFAKKVFGSLFTKIKCDNFGEMLRNGVRRIQDIAYAETVSAYVPKKKLTYAEIAIEARQTARRGTFIAGIPISEGIRPAPPNTWSTRPGAITPDPSWTVGRADPRPTDDLTDLEARTATNFTDVIVPAGVRTPRLRTGADSDFMPGQVRAMLRAQAEEAIRRNAPVVNTPILDDLMDDDF